MSHPKHQNTKLEAFICGEVFKRSYETDKQNWTDLDDVVNCGYLA